MGVINEVNCDVIGIIEKLVEGQFKFICNYCYFTLIIYYCWDVNGQRCCFVLLASFV